MYMPYKGVASYGSCIFGAYCYVLTDISTEYLYLKSKNVPTWFWLVIDTGRSLLLHVVCWDHYNTSAGFVYNWNSHISSATATITRSMNHCNIYMEVYTIGSKIRIIIYIYNESKSNWINTSFANLSYLSPRRHQPIC